MIDQRLRRYAVTGGRARPADDLPLAVPLTASGTPVRSGVPEHHSVVAACTDGPKTLVDLSSRLGAPVGVLRVLVLDLVDTGHLAAHMPTSHLAPHEDIDLLQEALDGIANL